MFAHSKKIGIGFIFFLIFLIVHYTDFFIRGEDFLSMLLNPVASRTVRAANFANQRLKAYSQSKTELVKQITTLEQTVNDLTFELLALRQIQNENKSLREFLQFQKQITHQLMVAEVIHKNTSEIERSIVVNRGMYDGVPVGSAVVSGKGVLIGKVLKVMPRSSLVRVTIDGKSSTLATLDGIPRTIVGVLQGIQGGSLALNLIPKNIHITPGQKIITNGLEDKIPSYLYLGEVVKLIESDDEIFNSALVKSPYSVEDLSIVGILIFKEK